MYLLCPSLFCKAGANISKGRLIHLHQTKRYVCWGSALQRQLFLCACSCGSVSYSHIYAKSRCLNAAVNIIGELTFSSANWRRSSWTSHTCPWTPIRRASADWMRRFRATLRNPADTAASKAGCILFLIRASATSPSAAIAARQAFTPATVSKMMLWRHMSTSLEGSWA